MLDTLKLFLFQKKLSETIVLDSKPIAISYTLKHKIKILGKKSLCVRAVDAGSTNNCEHEIIALENPIYDLNRFGIRVVASPRHADMLLVTGPVTEGMKEALIKTYEATPEPRIVLAVGDGAISGRISSCVPGKNLFKVSDCIPVDIEINGDPPSPITIASYLLNIINHA
jgi:Ni,Fe-hydrogenase III small subunit